MVLRIRDLLYEEKFTIAGAKKRLLEDMRGGSVRSRLAEEVAAEQATEPQTGSASPSPTALQSASTPMSSHTRSVLRMLKSDLEDLLTRLNTDASIKR
jgi:hypothetical protein